MAQFTILSVVTYVFVCLLSNVLSQQQLGDACTKSTQCQTKYCRDYRCINFGDVPDDVGAHPCATALCMAPSDCILVQVRCKQFPCPPVARCSVRPRFRY